MVVDAALGRRSPCVAEQEQRVRALGLVAVLSVIGVVLTPVPTLCQPLRAQSTPAAPTLPPTIPIFPLEDVVLFPNTSRPLHIFEARYRTMVADALTGDRIIGMVALQPGDETDTDGRPPVFAIGCAGTITDAEELPDGRYVIVLQGFVKFRVMSEETTEDQRRSYRLAAVDPIAEPLDDVMRQALGEKRQQLAAMMLSIAPSSPLFPASLSDAEFVDRLAQVLDLDPVVRQALLEQGDSVARANALIDILSRWMSVPV